MRVLLVAVLCAVGCRFDAPRDAVPSADSASAPLKSQPNGLRDEGLAAGSAQDPAWLAHIEDELAAREYHASEGTEGLQAPNRAHGLRTYFESTGIRVHDRTAPGFPELASLRLAGIGRGEHLLPAEPGTVASDGSRVEIRREGVVEWFVNRPGGLEQGFTLETRPRGVGDLVVELTVSKAEARVLGDSVVLETSAGRILTYSKLSVADAKGVLVAARFETPTPDRLRLVVEDVDASYPILIDPILTGTNDTVLISEEQVSTLFGYSVASAGDVDGDGFGDIIVGAYEYDAGETNEGAAFVFSGSSTGVASGNLGDAAAQIESNQAYAYLGVSVSGAGDVNGDGFDDVIVGSAFDDGEDAEGGAFIFHGGPLGIADGSPATAETHLQSNEIDGSLGYSVASAGDVDGDGFSDVIVGAPGYDALIANDPPTRQDSGEAYIFLGSSTGVADGTPSTAATRLQGDQPGGAFGANVASAGDVNGDGYSDVIIGAWHYSAGQTDESAAFIYHGSATGIPHATAPAAATQIESDSAGNGFIVVAGAGDVNGDGFSDVVVGLPLAGGVLDTGGAMVFHGSPTGIPNGSPEVGGFASFIYGDQNYAVLGSSVASAGDVNGDGFADVVIGAPRFDNPIEDEGVAFVLLGSVAGIPVGPAWTTAYKRLSVGNASALFGSSVAGAGDVNGDGYSDVIAGAPYHGEDDEGAAFVFLGGAEPMRDGATTNAATNIESDGSFAALGRSVAGAGDVNADGYADVIVGAPWYDGGEPDEGAAFVYLGGATGIVDGAPSAGVARLESNRSGAWLGSSVSGAGDVNGDGFADVIVGAPYYEDGQLQEGHAFVFLGSGDGIEDGSPATAAATIQSDVPLGRLGSSVGSAGDVNGDGYADVVVGAPGQYPQASGLAYVFHGAASGIADATPSSADAVLTLSEGFGQFGASVAGAGDVNGDGFADVIVGAPEYSGSGVPWGAAFVYRGSSEGILDGTQANAVMTIDALSSGLGESVSGAGDVNGDGFSDVIVGAPSDNRVFVFHGGSPLVPNPTLVEAGAQLGSDTYWYARFGQSVSSAGDVNGDGYADVVVGAPSYGDSLSFNSGAAFIFLGSADGIADGDSTAAASTFEAAPWADGLGQSVAGSGDVNGDGYADVILGADESSLGQQSGGAAFIFQAGESEGRPVLVEALQHDATYIGIQPWGASGYTSFQVRMRATHPAGRGRVKLEIEACPAGVPFGGTCSNHVSPTWTDVTATSNGVDLVESVSGLTPGILYHWRARVLHAHHSIDEPGITSPPNPAHGPWRRYSAQSNEADVRALIADFDGDDIPDGIDDDDDDDGLLDVAETGTGAFVSATDTGTSLRDVDTDDDGFHDGWEVSISVDPNDPGSPGFTVGVSSPPIQASDQPRYRWRTAQSNVYAVEAVAPANLGTSGGICSMSIPTQTECNQSQPQLFAGCVRVSFGFVQPPTPPTIGKACCSWQSTCELTCEHNRCSPSVGSQCPSKGPAETCQGNTPCVNESLTCTPGLPGDPCLAEQQRLLGLGTPACCFLSAGAVAYKWNASGLQPTSDADSDGFPDDCDNCVATFNRDQLDYDLDEIGNLCDPEYNPVPEPGGAAMLMAGIVFLCRLGMRNGLGSRPRI